MLPAEFLRRLPALVRPLLPESLQGFTALPRGHLCKLWYGSDGRVHYEIWAHENTRQLELGLHFEAEPTRNESLRRAFAQHLIELKTTLGPGVEVEPWDRGWARVYETHPLFPLTEARLADFGARTAQFIAAVQPLYAAVTQGD